MLGNKGRIIKKFMDNNLTDKGELGLTINQTALLFYPRKFGYDYARIKLRKMWQQGHIKKYTNDYSDEIIYYLEKKPSYHNNAVLNIYANFVSIGYEIKYFKYEQQWLGGKYRSDAFIIAENNSEIRMVIVEVDKSSPTNIKKYEELYETNELQSIYGDFPMLVILSDVNRQYKSENFTIVNIDIRCNDFNKVLI